MAVLKVAAEDELVQVRAGKLVSFQGEVHVGAQIVNPQCHSPRGLAGRPAVEQQF